MRDVVLYIVCLGMVFGLIVWGHEITTDEYALVSLIIGAVIRDIGSKSEKR